MPLLLTIGTVFFPIFLYLVRCQTVVYVDVEVVAALLPCFHVAVLHGEAAFEVKGLSRINLDLLRLVSSLYTAGLIHYQLKYAEH